MNDLVLVESKTARQQLIGKCSVLDKVKMLPYLTRDMKSTVQQVASYYEVPGDTIQSIIKRNRDEFKEDGILVIKGEELKKLFCDVQSGHNKNREGHGVPSKTRKLTLLPKRAILRVGMLLTDSDIASTVRNYLLNLEEIADAGQKDWSLQRELGKLRRRTMTDAIRDYIADTPNKHWKYKHFTDLVYKTALGISAKELRFERCARDNDQLRDKISKQELEAVEKAEVFVAGMIMAGYQYAEIKQKINGVPLLKTS